jgi:hypothetical protein
MTEDLDPSGEGGEWAYAVKMSASPVMRAIWGRRARVDPVVAYAEWRMSCASVWAAYRRWASATGADGSVAHAAYAAALDREDAAAEVYAAVMSRGRA